MTGCKDKANANLKLSQLFISAINTFSSISTFLQYVALHFTLLFSQNVVYEKVVDAKMMQVVSPNLDTQTKRRNSLKICVYVKQRI